MFACSLYCWRRIKGTQPAGLFHKCGCMKTTGLECIFSRHRQRCDIFFSSSGLFTEHGESDINCCSSNHGLQSAVQFGIAQEKSVAQTMNQLCLIAMHVDILPFCCLRATRHRTQDGQTVQNMHREHRFYKKGKYKLRQTENTRKCDVEN